MVKNNNWSLEFTNDIMPVSVNPIKLEDRIAICDKLEANDDLKEEHINRLCRKIQNDIDDIQIEFSDREDNSVQNFMRQWINLIDRDFKEQEDGLFKWFECSDDEQHPGAISMVLKKPLNELTEDDKKEIIELLREITDLEEDELKKLF